MANPEIDLNGTIELEGDWINNSTLANVFVNIEDVPNGNLILLGNTETNILGTTETYFENLTLKNSTKKLQVTNCEVNGVLTIDAVLELNSNKLILNNNFGINYISAYILSENMPNNGLGEIEIKLGDTEKVLNIPFGSGENENDLQISFEVLGAGNPSTGSITFATYPTAENNEPFPNSISDLGNFTEDKTINRFWKISPNFNTNPNFSLTLSYANNDIVDGINETNLQLIRYNTENDVWNDKTFNTTINSQNNTANTENILGTDFYSFWTLTEKVNSPPAFEIPNGITPNNDGFNDAWVINGLPENTKVEIFNRWGSKIFSSKNYNGEWNGNDNPSGAYYYLLTLSNGIKYSGDVNVLK